MSVSLFNLEKQMEAYAPYHMNKINQWIHIVCVPIILWTALVWVAGAVGPLVPGLDLGFGHLPYGPFAVNGAFLVITVYALFYILLEPVAGLMYAPILYGLAYTATHFAQTAAHPHTTALVIHVVCWILQFLGHGLAEKRAPALLDSFVQSLLLAPMFVWLEVLFMLGYNPELHKRIVNSASRNIVAFRKSQQAKLAAKAK